MKTLIYISLTILFISDCFAQSNLWQRYYSGPFDDDDVGYDICASTDGNYFLVGGAAGNSYPPGFYVIKINQNGQKLWSKLIGSGTGFAFTVAATPGGGCVVSGDLARFLKLDADGNILVNVPLLSVFRRINDIHKTIDNFYIGCGTYDIDSSLMINFDSIGNVIWQKIFPTTDRRSLHHIEEAINGGYIAVGRKSNFFNDSLKLNIIRTDTSGNTIWEKDYTGADGVTFQKTENNYTIVGQRHITKIDSSGRRYQTFLLMGLSPTTYEAVRDMEILLNNNYLFCTEIKEGGDSYTRILMSDSLGNPIRWKILHKSEFTLLTSIEKNNDNDFIFFGSTYYDTIPKANFYAIRTDSVLEIAPVGIINQNTIIPKEFVLYQNYPNPFNSSTIIKFDILKKDYYELEVYSLLGKKIYKLFGEVKNIGKYEINFNSENFPSGMYVYKLSNKNKYLIKSFIFLK